MSAATALAESLAPASALGQQAINSATGVALFPGGSVVRSRLETRSLAGAGADIDAQLVPTNISYGMSTDLTLAATIPYARKEVALGGGGRSATTDGLGDIFLFGKYRYYTSNYVGGSTQLAVIGGVKAPTGETDAVDDAGNRLPMRLQIGSGSTDFVGALTATSVLDYDWAAHASLLYKRNTEGDRDYHFGDFVNYNLALIRQIYHEPYPGPELYAGVELNGEYSARDERKGTEVANTGGNRIFLSPTFEAFLSRNWTFESSVQIPVEEDLNGQQPEANTRLVLGFRFQYATFR